MERPKSAATRPKTSVIGHYEMDKNIGEGNFAKVKLARHTITGQQVAVKIIDKNKLDKATSKKLFREVRIMRLLNQKNIVKLYEVIDTPDELYLVMEYLAGGEIFDYLVTHGRMKEKDARKYFRQIVPAIAYCHSLHIIHRDLKAENLLLDENMNVKIADFGFSNQFSPGQKLNTWCGSPPYAAPELFQGKEYSGPEVDIWSLGVVLYVFTSGSLPFDGSNLAKLRARVIAGKFQIPFYMSPGIICSLDCEKLIKKMLVLDPAKRITVEEIMKDKWYNEGYENEPVQVISTAPPVVTQEIHNAVLDELEELGLERNQVLKSLNEGTYDSLTATYYLVADRRTNNPNAPKQTPLSSPTKPTLQSKISKATDLECLDEDENGDVKPIVKREKAATTTPTTTPKPPSPKEKVVTGGRRRATVNTAPTNFTPEVKEELPPTRIPSAGKKVPQIASECKDQPPPLPLEPAPALPPIRPRAQTMATERKVEEDELIPIDKFKAHLSEAPRTARFTFSVSTTSTKQPTEVFDIVCKTLKNASVQYETKGLFATCKLNDIEFEVEVCKLPNLEVIGLRCKRLAGGAWDYKEVLSSLISNMDL